MNARELNSIVDEFGRRSNGIRPLNGAISKSFSEICHFPFNLSVSITRQINCKYSQKSRRGAAHI